MAKRTKFDRKMTRKGRNTALALAVPCVLTGLAGNTSAMAIGLFFFGFAVFPTGKGGGPSDWWSTLSDLLRR